MWLKIFGVVLNMLHASCFWCYVWNICYVIVIQNYFDNINITWSNVLLAENSISRVKWNINPFLTNVPISYPLKTPENVRFFRVFRVYKMGTLARNGLTKLFSAFSLKMVKLRPLDSHGFLPVNTWWVYFLDEIFQIKSRY